MSTKSLLPVLAASAIAFASGAADATVTTYTTMSSYTGAFTNASAGLTTSVSDPVNWNTFAAQIGDMVPTNGTIASGTQYTTGGTNPTASQGEVITPTVANGSSFTAYLNSSPSGTWRGDFANNASVLFTASSTITLTFATAVTGIGLDAQTLSLGSYQFTLSAFNSSGTQLASITSNNYTSTGKSTSAGGYPADYGTAGFLGITSTAADISYVTISATNNSLGFAIDTSLIYHLPINAQTAQTQTTPEPGTLALLGMGLVGLGFVRRRWKA